MCIICIDIARNKLSPFEAILNLSEMAVSLEEEHVDEVVKLIESILGDEKIDLDFKDLKL
jgi:hypothetical protein